MSELLEGGNRLIVASIEGSVFPESEKDIECPVIIDATRSSGELRISGSVYGRTVLLRGDVTVAGPILSRGDTRIEGAGGCVRLLGGLTVNGNLNCTGGEDPAATSAPPSLRQVSTIIKGDINVNQSLSLCNAIVFGSIRAASCRLENCVVLGTVVADESLAICMSSIAGYVAAKVVFEGSCIMIYAIGESSARPTFVPHEGRNGQLVPADVRFYPSLRSSFGLLNRSASSADAYPEHSRLDFDSDWVSVHASQNAAMNDSEATRVNRWVLSLGGRIGDLRQLQTSMEATTAMLKCGFEFEHYDESIRQQSLDTVLSRLTPEESWILREVCN